ncbi:MAG: hypothetical protein K2X99_02895 [Gemmatimonadaceae bacterium]|nr:hypothetical protein [Gemmatimonadaceae bacterium]
MATNSYELAGRFSWLLTLAIAFTLAGALAALAWRLKRAAPRALALAWMIHAAVAVDGALYFYATAYRSQLPIVLDSLFLMMMAGALAYAYGFAARSAAGSEGNAAPSLARAARWAVVAGAVGAAGMSLALALGIDATIVKISSSRIAFAIAYFTAIRQVLAAARRVPASRSLLLPLGAAMGVRVLQLGFDLSLRVSSVREGISGPQQVAVVLLQVITILLLGVAAIYVALEEERRFVVSQAARLRDAERAAARSARTESLGRLAGAVAHDVNNLLAVIRSSAELAEGDAAAHHHREELREIVTATESGHALTRQLLAFARGEPSVPVALPVRDAVTRTQPLISRLLGPQITLSVTGESRATVRMDPAHFEQLLMNLAANARDAMPGGGRVTIDIDEPSGREAFVRVRIVDTGPGIPADIIENVFEPFFTTKGEHDGTGLGLATCARVVRDAGGEISVRSTLGAGTCFEILLPRLADGDTP